MPQVRNNSKVLLGFRSLMFSKLKSQSLNSELTNSRFDHLTELFLSTLDFDWTSTMKRPITNKQLSAVVRVANDVVFITVYYLFCGIV